MVRAMKAVGAGIVVGAVLLGGVAHAQTVTTTTSTSSTTSTLLPHPFSAATAACVRQARASFQGCNKGAACPTAYQTAFASCFKAPTGVTCASKCIAKESTCLTSAPALQKTCNKNCGKTRYRDVIACRRIAADEDNIWAGGDASCLTTAAANYDLCKFVCTEAALDCRNAFKFCVADCPNL
jgi:hypothetical protein